MPYPPNTIKVYKAATTKILKECDDENAYDFLCDLDTVEKIIETFNNANKGHAVSCLKIVYRDFYKNNEYVDRIKKLTDGSQLRDKIKNAN